MAKRGAQLDAEKFSCSICLDLLKDPVAVPCGHSYCSDCIKRHWDEQEDSGFYSCPQCRKRFRRRPKLKKNILLAELVEDLKKTELQVAGPQDVSCDVCFGRKLKAVKSCLVCLASYCEEHLQPHYRSAAFKKHRLLEPCMKIQEKICSLHDEETEIFCLTDQQSICYLCTMDQHRGHETVPAAAERRQKQKELEESRLNVQQGIREREEAVKRLEGRMEAVNLEADEAVEESELHFNDMIRLIQDKSSEVKQQLRSQQQTAVSELKELQGKIERELSELKRKDVQMEQLVHTEDHTQFLISYPSVSVLSELTHSYSIKTAYLENFMDVPVGVSNTVDELQEILLQNITVKTTKQQLVPLRPQPETREDFLQYSQKITLDPKSAHRELLLSDKKRKVTYTEEAQPYSYHPQRFRRYLQVLSRESLNNRHYWEVEVRGEGVFVAVTYKDTSTAGGYTECGFGSNSKSWALFCDAASFKFQHNNKLTPVSGPWSSRVGVYLDHTAGVLSFFSVSETMTLLHKVQTAFTEPLHAGVWLYPEEGDCVEFLKPQ
ncbi:tripartite motif-containing protein 16-like [Salarias fasciatus]|uniref:Tripartite motif-containing protein 16-like n=1 Tax=Salarias fasciatus TaxID=181472 RepID=A0A672JCV3_SALFA|nr:tripartite motif-containing protein 16-like [Salarias fasciatus]